MISKDTIMTCNSREEARAYLKQFKIRELIAYAKEEEIHLMRYNKNFVIELIIEKSIGMRLAFEAIRNIDLNCKSRSW